MMNCERMGYFDEFIILNGELKKNLKNHKFFLKF